MTTIAYKDGKMAADSILAANGTAFIGFTKNIMQMENSSGRIITFGVASPVPSMMQEFANWIASEKDADCEPPDGRPLEALEVWDDGTVLFYRDSFIPTPIKTSGVAIGTGADFAMGAMLMGADAGKAIEIAGQLDPLTGGNYYIFDTVEAK